MKRRTLRLVRFRPGQFVTRRTDRLTDESTDVVLPATVRFAQQYRLFGIRAEVIR